MTIQDSEYLNKWGNYVRKWKRRTIILGIAFVANILAVIPFLNDYVLHPYFKQGRVLLIVAGIFFTLFVGSAALTFNFWRYLRKIETNNRQ